MPQRTSLVKRLIEWVDCHPRTGWYLCVIATLNLVLNLMDAFDLF